MQPSRIHSLLSGAVVALLRCYRPFRPRLMRSIAVHGATWLLLCGASSALRPALAYLSTTSPGVIRSRCGIVATPRADLAIGGCLRDEDARIDRRPSMITTDRRGAVFALGSLVPVLAAAVTVTTYPMAVGEAKAAAAAEVRGTPVTPFNSLMFQYRGNDFAGLRAEDLSEPSISYGEFMDSLKAGMVSFVEFLAPDGDAAYATLQDHEAPIRIGEGYPIEQHDGYSSPAFAIRAVQNAGVPYRFTVPGLAKFSTPTTTPTTASRKQ